MGHTAPAPALRRSRLVALTVVISVAAPAFASAGATPTAFPTDGGTAGTCTAGTGYVQSFAGPDLRAASGLPELGGIITRWLYRAGPAGGSLAMQTLTGDLNTPGVYKPVGESAVETLTPAALNTFATRIPIASDSHDGRDELLGLRVVSGTPDCRYSGFPIDDVREVAPAPALGSAPTPFGAAQPGFHLNLQIVVEDDRDGDGFGDETQDGCATSPARQDDCVKPTVTLEKGVPKKRKIKFVFSSDDPAATFECHLENKKFKPCTTPLKLKRLKPGLHNFTVRAVDAAGNASRQTSFRWRVEG